MFVKAPVVFGKDGWEIKLGNEKIVFMPSASSSQVMQSILQYNDVPFKINKKYGSIIVQPDNITSLFSIILKSEEGTILSSVTNDGFRTILYTIVKTLTSSPLSDEELCPGPFPLTHTTPDEEFDITYETNHDPVEIDTSMFHSFFPALAKVYSCLWQESNKLLKASQERTFNWQANDGNWDATYDIFQNFIHKLWLGKLLTPHLFEQLIGEGGYKFFKDLLNIENQIPRLVGDSPTIIMEEWIRMYIQYAMKRYDDYKKHEFAKEIVDSWLMEEVIK